MTTCFVIQGFGKKTDYTDGRVLDLDASYAIIKEAVEAAGLQCIRADEITHAEVIDVPMYEMLLQADLVIADLSTYNVNAAYELGVRYALRPGTTIVVAEEKFHYPFDVGHIAIQRYKHLGDDIGTQEGRRFKEALKKAIQEIMASGRPDSPVYTFLPKLSPPRMPPAPAPTAPPPTAGAPLARGGAFEMATADAPMADDFPEADEAPEQPVAPTPKAMLDDALARINPPEGTSSDFAGARQLLLKVKEQRPNDPFVIQQLVIATYKAKQPNLEAALNEARGIMVENLNPASTNDPESLGLWGAIHKRLWEIKGLREDLSNAVDGYERGFYLRRDWYTGINFAFLLDLRALEWLKTGDKNDAIADSVQARRVRSEVAKLAQAQAQNKEADPQKRFWAAATLWEAALGLGDVGETARWEAEAHALGVPQWMQDTRLEQGRKLVALQTEFARRLAEG